MLRKLRKLILHPNLYFYDYFRKKIGFKKYFVSEKIKLLDTKNHHKWIKLLRSDPHLYLYYKFNKRLHNPSYPILVDYRIEHLPENQFSAGKREVLAVELERKNTIYFAEPNIVLKAIENIETNLSEIIFKFIFQGHGNSVFIDSSVFFGPEIRLNFVGNYNHLEIGKNCRLAGGEINFNGNENTFELKNDCTVNSGFKVIFIQDKNYLYAGPNCKFNASSVLKFFCSNGLMFLYGNQSINMIDALVTNNNILFLGENITNSGDVRFWAWATKNLLIGSDVMMSRFLCFRTSDGHLIYDKFTKQRTNHSKSIIIGDHVWIGEYASILKGAHIEDGAVIGAESVVNKHIPKNCIAAGSPAKVVREDIMWDRTEDSLKTTDEIKEYESYQKPKYIYKSIGYDNLIKIDSIDCNFSSKEKVVIIQKILNG